jgi:hypothetical protein
MLQLGPLAFAQPWLLTALLGLPILWWLLRVTPPAARRLSFPAIRLLFGLTPPEETPARTPWWLLTLRLLAIALAVLGLAQPLLNPAARLTGTGPLVLAIDDGWTAARNWAAREALLDDLLDQAERGNRPVVVLTTAPGPLDEPIAASGLLSAPEARRLVQGLKPRPWPQDREAALEAVRALDIEGSAHAVWLSDGLDAGQVRPLAERLQALGRLDVVRDTDAELPRLVLPPDERAASLVVRLRRASASDPDSAVVLASADDGRLVARVPVSFATGEHEASALVELPLELRNRVARLSIEGERQAGAVLLLDGRWRRHPVGLVTAGPSDEAQPLLSQHYYLERALRPYTELRLDSIEALLARELALLVLVDRGPLDDADRERVTAWVSSGGLLLRFAGPRLAESGGDGLLPVALRGGGRTLGGIMTWDRPARLAPFDREGPFAGLRPPTDVLVRRQVLAEPSLDLGDKTWARLSDGTPLVTATQRGNGWVVLFHSTANNNWTNLPLSGLFVDMLRRIVALSQGVAGDSESAEALAPVETLNGFGHLGAPAPTVLAADRETLDEGRIEPRHPPGYYGDEERRRAHNLASGDPALRPMKGLPPGVNLAFYSKSGETELMPWLLVAALALLLLDMAIALGLRGLLPGQGLRGRGGRAGAAAAGLIVLACVALAAGEARAQTGQAGAATATDDDFAIQATLETRLAYVETGVAEVDSISRAGLQGLSRVLARRTSVEPGEPMGVDPERDELAFFPLLYWPVVPDDIPLDEQAARRVNAYLGQGGTILFDLREAAAGAQVLGRASRGGEALMRLTRGLDLPPLIPVPPEHVLTKSFYLMQDFPGRYAGGTLWVGVTEGRVNDGVASVLVGSNDWAAAWAVDANGRPMFAVVPGGERQRELSYRVGVNLVMYAFTGNYKADQVHVPFILERLGQ